MCVHNLSPIFGHPQDIRLSNAPLIQIPTVDGTFSIFESGSYIRDSNMSTSCFIPTETVVTHQLSGPPMSAIPINATVATTPGSNNLEFSQAILSHDRSVISPLRDGHASCSKEFGLFSGSHLT